MARSTTSLLGLGTWTDLDNPGAGSQSVSAGSIGLNANWIILDTCIGANLNADGSWKNAVIPAAALKSTVPDGATIIQDTSTKKLRVTNVSGDALGLGTDNLAAKIVTGAKIADHTITNLNMGNTGGSEPVDTANIKDGAVTLVKLGSDAIAVVAQSVLSLPSLALAASGNVAAGFTEWLESGGSLLTKIQFGFRKRASDKKLNFMISARASAGTWQLQVACYPFIPLSGATISTTLTGVNTSYSTTVPEVVTSLDISGYATDAIITVQINLCELTGGGIAKMQNPMVTVSNS